MRQRAALGPLIQAWIPRHAQDIRRAGKSGQIQQEMERRVNQTTKRIYQSFGVQTWKMWSGLASLPVWLLAMESLRRMSGGGYGLLGSLFFGSKVDTQAQQRSEAGSASSNPADAISVTDVMHVDDTVLSELPMPDLPPGADPSLATGGCLWFTDLMAPDPLNILPILLSIVLVSNVLPKSAARMRAVFGSAPSKNEVIQPGVDGRGRLTKFLLLLSIAAGPLTSGLPAALHLYWISSSTFGLIISQLVTRAMPIRSGRVRPCLGIEKADYRLQHTHK
jgi:inner membrane protein COX18